MKAIYAFEDADSKNRALLGGKGAGLSEMTKLKLPVPPGFILFIVELMSLGQTECSTSPDVPVPPAKN